MIQKFIIQLKDKIQGKYFSEFLSNHKGSGLEMDEIRQYVPGDPRKHIHRKASAKHEQLFLKVFDESKAVDLDIFLDINYNRRGSIHTTENYILAAEVLTDIFLYAQKHYLPTTLLYPHEGRLEQKKLSQDMTEAIYFLEELPSKLAKVPNRYQSHIPHFLTHSKHSTQKRAIVILSDFLDLSEQDHQTLKFLQDEHSLHLYRLPIDLDGGQNYLSAETPAREGLDVVEVTY